MKLVKRIFEELKLGAYVVDRLQLENKVAVGIGIFAAAILSILFGGLFAAALALAFCWASICLVAIKLQRFVWRYPATAEKLCETYATIAEVYHSYKLDRRIGR